MVTDFNTRTPDQEEDKNFLITIPYKGGLRLCLVGISPKGYNLKSESFGGDSGEAGDIETLPETAMPIVLGDRGFGREVFLLKDFPLERGNVYGCRGFIPGGRSGQR
jgi:hypothetical protein